MTIKELRKMLKKLPSHYEIEFGTNLRTVASLDIDEGKPKQDIDIIHFNKIILDVESDKALFAFTDNKECKQFLWRS